MAAPSSAAPAPAATAHDAATTLADAKAAPGVVLVIHLGRVGRFSGGL
jgi:hypothetical protein